MVAGQLFMASTIFLLLRQVDVSYLASWSSSVASKPPGRTGDTLPLAKS